jgi:hypothetical protein
MATSPNYAWAEPDNSSLVKNGAADIRTLGDAIDTSVWNVGFGQAGKNKIINGNFAINQRNFTTDSVGGYCFDRFVNSFSGATATATAQTFALGTAPVAGYEAKNFLRLAVTTGADFCRILQNIESVRTFAGQTATLSFWAKGTNPTTSGNLKTTIVQNFGSGGSPSTEIRSAEQTFVLTANWTRYSFTFAVPSIAGKTIGTANDDRLTIEIGQQSNTSADAWTLDLWGVQMEYGSKATPFQLAGGGDPQSELAMCQRYYYRFTPTATTRIGVGYVDSTTFANVNFVFPIPMRTAPTALEQSGTATDYSVANNTTIVCSAVPTFSSGSLQSCNVGLQVAAGLVLGQAVQARLIGTAGYLGWSAEL